MNFSWKMLFPFLVWIPTLNKQIIQGDLIAGITGAIIVLPQGVAYAIIAGLPPEYGLYSAIIPAIIAALFGSSYHLISGPTVAMSIVIFGTISPLAPPGSPEFIHLALTMTLIAGLFQLILGIARMGVLVNFVSHSVVIGFTAGAAVLIATSQLKNVFGLNISANESFFHTLVAIIKSLPQTNLYVFLVALATLVIAVLFKKYLSRWPGMLIAMVIGSLIALGLDAQAHGIKLVGSLPSQLPPLSLPHFDGKIWSDLTPSALAIALLGLVEAVSIARAVATRSHQMIDGNQEFVGQGLSNVIGAFFSCYAASGSFTRTGVNYDAGAKTPLAALFAAVSLAIIVLLVAPLTAYVPIPSMAGVLLLVSFNLIDFHHIKTILKASGSEASVLVVTFLSALFVHLEFAIYIGVILSLLVYLNRTSKPNVVSLSPDKDDPNRRLINIARKPELQECPQVKIIRIDGSLFFGAINSVAKTLQNINESHILIVSDGINFIDVAGAEMLMNEAKRRRELGGGLYFTKVKARAHEIFDEGDYISEIHDDTIFDTKVEAIQGIFVRLDKKQCQHCRVRIFQECASIKYE
ncbi:MAG: sodium-independent anion transporter [Beggiatoa sp. IS2]|nr:MAG: sodium-independent anion transporter [Beggiatoa sp. IS2]